MKQLITTIIISLFLISCVPLSTENGKKCEEGSTFIKGKCVVNGVVNDNKEIDICAESEKQSQSCAIANGSGLQTRTCSNNAWGSYGTCIASTCSSGYELKNNQCQKIVVVCTEGQTQSQSCSVANGSGLQTRACSNNAWGNYGTCIASTCSSGYELKNNQCQKIVVCTEGQVQSQSCSVANGSGLQTRACSKNAWGNYGTCVASTCSIGYELKNNQCQKIVVCTDGQVQSQSCSVANGSGLQTRTCSNNAWGNYGTCIASTCSNGYELKNNQCQKIVVVCTDGQTQSQACSVANGSGLQTRACSKNAWGNYGTCVASTCSNGYELKNNQCISICSNIQEITSKIYYHVAIHSEEDDAFCKSRSNPAIPDYNNNEQVFRKYATLLYENLKTLATYKAAVSYQPDWTFIEGVKNFWPSYFQELKNISGLQLEILPHAHETCKSYNEVYLMLQDLDVTTYPIFGGMLFEDYLASDDRLASDYSDWSFWDSPNATLNHQADNPTPAMAFRAPFPSEVKEWKDILIHRENSNIIMTGNLPIKMKNKRVVGKYIISSYGFYGLREIESKQSSVLDIIKQDVMPGIQDGSIAFANPHTVIELFKKYEQCLDLKDGDIIPTSPSITSTPSTTNNCDFNNDGKVDDIEKKVCGNATTPTPTPTPNTANNCDFNSDGKVDDIEKKVCGNATTPTPTPTPTPNTANNCDLNSDGKVDDIEKKMCGTSTTPTPTPTPIPTPIATPKPVSTPLPSAPANVTISAVNKTASQIGIVWNNVSGASTYFVLWSGDNGDNRSIHTSTNWIIFDTKPGVNYWITIYAGNSAQKYSSGTPGGPYKY